MSRRLVAIGITGRQEQTDLLGFDARDRILSRSRSHRCAARLAGDKGSQVSQASDTPLKSSDQNAGAISGSQSTSWSTRAILRSNAAAQSSPAQAPGLSAAGGDSEKSRGSLQGGEGAMIGQAVVEMSQPFACGSFKNAYLGKMNDTRICVLRHRGGLSPSLLCPTIQFLRCAWSLPLLTDDEGSRRTACCLFEEAGSRAAATDVLHGRRRGGGECGGRARAQHPQAHWAAPQPRPVSGDISLQGA